MVFWKSADRPRYRLPAVLLAALLAAMALLAGCRTGDTGDTVAAADASHLAIIGVQHTPSGGPHLVLAIRLARPLRQALESGVPLTFRLDLDTASGRHSHWRELRFAPLSRRYQIHDPATGYRRSYDSRAAALTALERWPVASQAVAGQDANDNEAPAPWQARVRLDTARLPAPLVLPALFDRDWQLDSGRWHAGRA